MGPVKIGVLGANGRVGRMILAEIAARPDLYVLGGAAGRGDDHTAVFAAAEVVIDFSVAGATVHHAALARETGRPLVSGVTGLSPEAEAALDRAASSAPILHAANMSLGVTLLAALVEQAAARLGPDDFDIEIFEAHHRRKVDAPSGTALLLGHAAAKGRSVELSRVLCEDREGARAPGVIGMQVFRGGDVVGEHTVFFAGMGERIELAHKATDRAIFARGALKAALWLRGRAPGRYTMRDVLEV